jgi:hypothetical protein
VAAAGRGKKVDVPVVILQNNIVICPNHKWFTTKKITKHPTMKITSKLIPLLLLLGCHAGKTLKKDCAEKTRDDSMCLAIYEPVCGCNQKTYGNECEARAYGITVFTKGECPDKE